MKKRNLILGIGGTGAKAAQSAFCMDDDCVVVPIVFDTDAAALEKLNIPNKMDLSANETLGSALEKLEENCYSWMSFYGEKGKARITCADLARMNIGAGGWRAKSVLSFLAFCSIAENREKLHAAIDSAFEGSTAEDVFELYAVASLAGGTGSGLLLPLTLYVKKYIREKYGVRIRTAALLMSSEVFTYSLSSAQRTIANANAYATMRELNAINQTAWGKTAPGAPRFTIGSAENSAIGALFDSADPQFTKPEALPFDRVYLFEKNPGTDSILVHNELFSKVLASLCKSKILQFSLEKPKSEPEAVYAGISLAEITTGAAGTANYIALQTVSDFFAADFGVSVTAVELRLKAARLEEVGKGRRESDIGDYIAAVAEISDEKDEYSEKDDSDDEEDLEAEEANGIKRFQPAYFERVLELVNKTVVSEESIRFSKELNKSIFPPKTRVKAKEKRQMVVDAALSYINKLKEIFVSDYKTVLAAEDKVIAEMIDAVMKNGDRFVDPEVALVGLCRFYRHINGILRPIKKNVLPENAEDLFELGEVHILHKILDESRSKKGFNPRFLRTLDRDEPIVRLDADEKLFIIKWLLSNRLYEKIKAALLSLICKYRVLFAKVRISAGKLEEEIRSALHSANIQKCGHLTLYSSEDCKRLYRKYQKDYPEAIDLPGILGRDFFDYAQGHDDLIAYNGAGIVQSAQEQAVKLILASAYYRNAVDLGAAAVFAVKSEREKAFSERMAALLYQFANPQLKTIQTEDAAWGDPHEEVTYLILSSSAGQTEALLEEMHNYACRELLLNVSDKCISLVRETQDLGIEALAAFCETTADATCYRAYENSLKFTREFATAVWYPHIIGNIEFNNPLPFLSAKKQEEYDRSVIRAFLYSLISGVYSVGSSDNPKSELLYFRGSDCSRLPVTIGEKVLTSNNWGLLPAWLRRREEKIKAWNDAYCELLARDLRELPSVGFNGLHVAELIRAIKRSPLIRAMRENLFEQVIFFDGSIRLGIFEFAYWQKLAEKENGGEKIAEKLLVEGLEVIRAFCTYRIPESEPESRRVVAGEIEQYFLDFLRENAGDATAKAVSKWIKEHGGF